MPKSKSDKKKKIEYSSDSDEDDRIINDYDDSKMYDESIESESDFV